MPATLEEKVTQCLGTANLTMVRLAMGVLEFQLATLCRLGDLRLSELGRLAKCLRVPPTYFLSGSFLQPGNSNTQKIKIGKAAAHELAEQLGVCRRALEQSQQLVAAMNELLATKDALIASKEETIDLLKAAFNFRTDESITDSH
jgi:hypothetical protein